MEATYILQTEQIRPVLYLYLPICYPRKKSKKCENKVAFWYQIVKHEKMWTNRIGIGCSMYSVYVYTQYLPIQYNVEYMDI
jgi:hypothetical protein